MEVILKLGQYLLVAHDCLGTETIIRSQWNETKMHTLRVYLECERSYVKTAKQLYIHRNSLLYRIQRIQELTCLDFSDPSTRLHLLMSYAVQDRKETAV